MSKPNLKHYPPTSSIAEVPPKIINSSGLSLIIGCMVNTTTQIAFRSRITQNAKWCQIIKIIVQSITVS